MVNVIIFSKDRACQLDALLRSMKENFFHLHNTTVLFKASSDRFLEGYKKLWLHKDLNVRWMMESNFEIDVNHLLSEIKGEYTMFVVDDIIYTSSITCDDVFIEFATNPEILALSLRLGKRINYCYTKDAKSEPPNFKGKFNTWEWRKAKGIEWSYPMSIDSTIFRSKDIIPLIDSLHFTGPNLLESALVTNPLKQRLMICYDEPKLVNLPLNKVHNFNNRCGDIHQDKLNELWLECKRIKLEPIYKLTNDAPHYLVEPEFETTI